MQIETTPFGMTNDGQPVHRFTITGKNGHSISLTDFGASLMDVNVPDRDGKLSNVNLAFDSLAPYLARHPYFGSTVGRFCNRIANGTFTIDGKTYQVTKNIGKHHLHGGVVAFDHLLWKSETYQSDNAAGVRFTLVSPDGDEGFPGTVTAIADYSFSDDDELTMVFSATTDAPTHVNLTNHSYWNLAGAGSGKVYDQTMKIEADEVLDVDDDSIPTGKLNDVADTPLDFRKASPLGPHIDEMKKSNGVDHCFVVRGKPGTLRLAATATDPKSGRVMTVLTTQPGMQLYTSNFLPGDDSSGGHASHEAFCVETQHYPNACNIPSFPTTLLKPGETMTETTIHRFSVER